jgi:membrane protein
MMVGRRKLTLRGFRAALWRTVEDVTRKHTPQMAAALSYYFVLALFPALVLLSAVVAYLPINDLLNQVVDLFGSFVPADSMQLMRNFVANVVIPNRATLLSFGVLGTLWSASGGFASAIEALNIAYEVDEGRPFWVTRPIAVGLTFLVGVLLLIAFGVMVLGPEFGQRLAEHHKLSRLFATAWPYFHWTISFAFTVLAVEFLYYLAPNVKQRFWSTLPGAILSVGCWIGLSYILGIYFRNFAHVSKTYGTLGAVVALMVWLYWNGFMMLLGAELNCQLAKETRAGKIPQDEDKSGLTRLDLAA